MSEALAASIVQKSPFMADEKDPLVLSNYIFELLEVNQVVARFLIQLHPEDVDAVVESVTAHAEKAAGTKTTLHVGQEEEEEVEEEVEEVVEVGAGRGKEKPHNPLMIRRLKNCFKGWSLVRPSMSLRHMHHCMSMNALEQGRVQSPHHVQNDSPQGASC